MLTLKFSFSELPSPFSTCVIYKKASAMHQMIKPLTFIDCTVGKLVDPESIMLIVLPLSFVDSPITIKIGA